jgi:hypothetical protein
MKWTCDKCNTTLKTRYSLECHKKRKIPCDHKCKFCGEQFKDTRNLTKHMKRDHAQKENAEVEEMETFQPMRNTEMMSYKEAKRRFMTPHVPLEDYNWEALTQSKHHRLWLTKRTEIPGGKQVVEHFAYERYIVERSENLNDDMNDHTKMRTLCLLNEDNDRIEQQLLQLLCEVNAQQATPRLHSLCPTPDGRIATFNRITPESDDCRWTSHEPDKVDEIVNNHSKRLLMFALQAGIYLLKLGIWMLHGTPVLFTYESHTDGNCYVIVVHYDTTIEELRCQRNSKLDLKEFYRMPDYLSPALQEKTTHLITLVEQRKQEIVSTLQNAQLSRKNIDFYLNHSRKECVATAAVATSI